MIFLMVIMVARHNSGTTLFSLDAFDDSDDAVDDDGGLVFIVGLVISPTTRISRKFSTPERQSFVKCKKILIALMNLYAPKFIVKIR